MVVRFEVDAYLLQEPSEVLENHEPKLAIVRNISRTTFDESQFIPARPAPRPNIEIIHAGSAVPQSSLIEIKTRTTNSIDKSMLKKEFPQLYFSQTPYRYVALHDSGDFSLIRKEEVGQGVMSDAEENIQAGLRNLFPVLEYIQQLVSSRGLGARLTIICADGSLKFYERTDRASCLPGDLLGLFHRKEIRE